MYARRRSYTRCVYQYYELPIRLLVCACIRTGIPHANIHMYIHIYPRIIALTHMYISVYFVVSSRVYAMTGPFSFFESSEVSGQGSIHTLYVCTPVGLRYAPLQRCDNFNTLENFKRHIYLNRHPTYTYIQSHLPGI